MKYKLQFRQGGSDKGSTLSWHGHGMAIETTTNQIFVENINDKTQNSFGMTRNFSASIEFGNRTNS